MDKNLAELYRLFSDVYAEHEKEVRAGNQLKAEYWQGKKDGLRTALALMDTNKSIHWELENNSSHGKRATDFEITQKMLEDACYYIGEALYLFRSKKKLNIQSKINWEQWYSWYKQMMKKGIVPVVDNDANTI